MKTIQPKDHPSFIRALSLAHGRIMALRSSRNRALSGITSQEDAEKTMTLLAHQAYTDAIATLERECTKRVRLEYEIEGTIFIEEACHKLRAKDDTLADLVARALSESHDTMPSRIRVKLDIGLCEDGLVFGSANHEAISGSFQSLHSCVNLAMKRLLSTEDVVATTDSIRLALVSIIQQTLPSDEPREERPLAAHVNDLHTRLSSMAHVILQVNDDTPETLKGLQASKRIAQLSLDAHAERPNAASLSLFLSKLGI